jgi:dephospho-CoA kinase
MEQKPNCFTIGLTGGIASGKSAVSHLFEQLGTDIIDADIIAREVVATNSTGLTKIVTEFGTDILSSNNELDRANLRKIIFNDENKRAKLNAIIHPLVHQSINKKINGISSSFCIVVIPLLCESTNYGWLNRILVVDASIETQLTRLLKRDAIDEALAMKMINSQCSRKKRLTIADDIINNEQSLAELKIKVQYLNRLYKTL